jgi:hypothetical protein
MEEEAYAPARQIMVVSGVLPLGLSSVAAVLADFVCRGLPVSGVNHSQDGISDVSGGDYSLPPGKTGVSGSSPVSVRGYATIGDGSGDPAGAHMFIFASEADVQFLPPPPRWGGQTIMDTRLPEVANAVRQSGGRGVVRR